MYQNRLRINNKVIFKWFTRYKYHH